MTEKLFLGYLCHVKDLGLGIEHLSIPVLTSEHAVEGGWADLRHFQLTGKMQMIQLSWFHIGGIHDRAALIVAPQPLTEKKNKHGRI